METTKITVKAWRPLLASFNKGVNDCFLKRDAFLNQMISAELRSLRSELDGKRQSDKAKRYISGELRMLGTETINVVVDKSVSSELKDIVDQTNLVRDAFINRLMLFLLAPEDLLSYLELPVYIVSTRSRINDSMPTSPLGGIKSIAYDPLFYLRNDLDMDQAEPLYRLRLPKIMKKEMTGLTCFLDDDQIPDTEAYRARLAREKELFEVFDLPTRKGDQNV